MRDLSRSARPAARRRYRRCRRGDAHDVVGQLQDVQFVRGLGREDKDEMVLDRVSHVVVFHLHVDLVERFEILQRLASGRWWPLAAERAASRWALDPGLQNQNGERGSLGRSVTNGSTRSAVPRVIDSILCD